MASPPKEKPRLTEQEKKSNHIASEQKRRQAIRDGFDKLCERVPGMTGQGRSENAALQASIDYLRLNLTDYRELLEQAKKQGVDVSDLKLQGVDDIEPEESKEKDAAASA